MYKHASRSDQRRYKVHEIDFQPRGHSEDEFIPTAANMGLRECQQERAQLMLEKVRFEQEMHASTGPERARLGLKYQTICSRLSMIGRRIKEINREDSDSAFRTAVREYAGEDGWRAIIERQAELVEAMRAR